MIWFSQTIQYRIWPPRPSLEYLLNYKTFSGFPSLDKTAADLTGTMSQQLAPDSFFSLGAMLTNYHVFQGSSLSKSSTFGGIKQNHFWKEIFISTERKNGYNFWQVGYFKWRRFLSSTLYFFTVIWTQTAGLVTSLNPLSSLIRISCRFQFHNLWRAWNGQHRLFHNLALFSIYRNDGATISRRSVIINLKKYHRKKVQKGIPL